MTEIQPQESRTLDSMDNWEAVIQPMRDYELEDFVLEPGTAEGVALRGLPAGTVLAIHTRHSHYRVTVVDGDAHHVLVRGGSRFPDWTEARVEGATGGGSAIKVGWIGVGLRVELAVGARRITTSAVESLAIESVN